MKAPTHNSQRELAAKASHLPIHYLLAYPQWRLLSDALYDFGFAAEAEREHAQKNLFERFWEFHHILTSFENFSEITQRIETSRPDSTELAEIKLLDDGMMDLMLLLVPDTIPTPLIDYRGQVGLYLGLSGSVGVCQYSDQHIEISQHYAISKLRRECCKEVQIQDLLAIERQRRNIHELQANSHGGLLLRIRLQCDDLARYWMFPITPKRLDSEDFFVRRILRSD